MNKKLCDLLAKAYGLVVETAAPVVFFFEKCEAARV